MQLTVGTHRLPCTDGVILIRGRRQIALEWGPVDTTPLLTMDLYAGGGGHIARLRRNCWTFNDHDRFQFAADTRGFNLIDTKSSQVVLEARVVGREAVVITGGVFYNAAGQQIEITEERWSDASDRSARVEPETRATYTPFGSDEIARIRRTVGSASDAVHCPRCGCPLVREHVVGRSRLETILVTCIICRCSLAIRDGP